MPETPEKPVKSAVSEKAATPPTQMGQAHHHKMVLTHLHGAEAGLSGAVDMSAEGPTKSRKPKKVPELNIVAMLDVCFNLLIFFICAASFAVGEGVLQANMPSGSGSKAASPNDIPEQPINIMLRSSGGNEYVIEVSGFSQTIGSFSELTKFLISQQRNDSNPSGLYVPESPVIIKPDASVAWDHVVNAFNSAVRAKFSNVSFAQAQK